jgi:uncharacterized protein YqjF (DUF2071 family)
MMSIAVRGRLKTMIDRSSPSQRPAGANDGTQTWESLLFCHWAIPFRLLRELVPAELEIDTFDDQAFVGVVPFKMRHIRPRWLPRALAFNFLETNVRTYVVHQGKPGVYFFSLEASSRLAVWAARIGWSLPYHFARMSASCVDHQHRYQSCRSSGVKHHVTFRVGQELGPSRAGTLEHFLLERYLLFVARRNQIHVGQVHHQPYHAYLADVQTLQDDLVEAAGFPAVTGPPELAHYCPGVDVEVFGIQGATLRRQDS